jgi:PPOX class probable F420-dependent enzyme
MEVTRALEWIRDNHRAVLATTRSDGGLQMSPVLAGIDENDKVVISSRQTALKTKNVRARPRATLLVFTEAFYGQWVQVEGSVEIVSLPEAMEGLVSYYRGISGEHQDWDEYRRSMTAEQRVLLQMSVERAGPDKAG